MREGEFDSSGRGILPFRLEKSLKGPDRVINAFQDLAMAAYVTDLSSGRHRAAAALSACHQRTRHLYLTADSESRRTAASRIRNASYADGTPASVHGVLEAARPMMRVTLTLLTVSHGQFHTTDWSCSIRFASVTGELAHRSALLQLGTSDWRTDGNTI